ncbi:MAG: creatininase family protein [Thermomicrobiales bacterium]
MADLTSPESASILPDLGLVLLPVGAHEQHGGNIAVSTDTVCADALCREAAAMLGPRVAVAPAVPWGISWHHLAFPGTISLRPATLIALLDDIVASLQAHGVRRILIVNGHGGNSATIAVAIEQIKQTHQIPLIAAVFGYALLAEQGASLLQREQIGHGGADEAAVVMAVAPDLARQESFEGPRLTGALAETDAMLRAYGGFIARPFHEKTENGVTGDATGATAELGRQILDRAARRLVDFVEVLLRESGD